MSNIDDDDFEMIATLVATGKLIGFAVSSDEWYEERSTRKRNQHSNFLAMSARFERVWFSENSMYPNKGFEHHFCMPRAIVYKTKNAINGRNALVDESKDATEKSRVPVRIHLIADIRFLSFEMSFDQVEELCDLSTSSKKKSILKFFR